MNNGNPSVMLYRFAMPAYKADFHDTHTNTLAHVYVC